MPYADAKFKYLNILMALNVTFLLVSDFTDARIMAIYGVGVSVTVLYFPFTYLMGDILTEVHHYGQARFGVWHITERAAFEADPA
jgi:queuosine precursor transporter